MELVPGGELFNMIEAEAPFSEPTAALVMSQLGAAVHYLHSDLKIIHRDIKPEKSPP